MNKKIFMSIISMFILAATTLLTMTSCNNDDNDGYRNANALKGNYNGKIIVNKDTSDVDIAINDYYVGVAKFPVKQLICAAITDPAQQAEALKNAKDGTLNMVYMAPEDTVKIPVKLAQQVVRLNVTIDKKQHTILAKFSSDAKNYYTIKTDSLNMKLDVKEMAYDNQTIKNFKELSYEIKAAKKKETPKKK
ncbi:MAG: DUF4840 domain-containing protein [Prevotella sp.]|nr:DUF4840 domain-containing protein [Prevotella sp.]